MDDVKSTRLTELIIGEQPFYSNGISVVKVTKINEEGENEETYLEIPIQSVGVPELQQELEAKRPRPPVKRILVTKNSDLARELGVNNSVYVQMFDETDQEYRKKLDAYREEEGWKLLLKGICIKFVDKDTKKEITDDNIKKKALFDAGLTFQQMMQITKDINRLTASKEEHIDFLSEGPLE